MNSLLYAFSDAEDSRSGFGALSTTDRLQSVVTVGLLLAIAGFLTTTHYVTDTPIECWSPADFTKSRKKYTNQVGFCLCFFIGNDLR